MDVLYVEKGAFKVVMTDCSLIFETELDLGEFCFFLMFLNTIFKWLFLCGPQL